MKNSVLEKKGGKLVLQDKFIVPKHYTMQKTISKKENATEMEEGFGKLIFCKKYGLDHEELQQCIENGEVVTWKSGGLRLYAARNVTFKNEAEKNTAEVLETDSIELDKTAGETFARVFDQVVPEVTLENIGSSSAGSKSIPAESQSKQFLAFFGCSKARAFVLAFVLALSCSCGLFLLKLKINFTCWSQCSLKPSPFFPRDICCRLALMDREEAEMTGQSLQKGHEALSLAKAAVEKLMKDGKALLAKIESNENDDVFQTATPDCIYTILDSRLMVSSTDA